MFSPQAVNQRVDAFRGNPQALMQKYAVSQDLLDLLALQQINKEKQDAARQMQIQMAQQQGRPQTVADQVERETLDLTRQEMAQKLAPLAQQSAQMQGIAGVPAPNMEPMKMAQGGIVGYQEGGPTPDEDEETVLGQKVSREDYLRERAKRDRERLLEILAGAKPGMEKGIAALRDIGTMPIRAGARVLDETAIRLLRASGIAVPELAPMATPEGASPESKTPFMDIIRRREGDVAAQRRGAQERAGEPQQQGAPATTNAPELMLSAPGPGGRARPPKPPRVEEKPKIMAQPDRGGPAEIMAQPDLVQSLDRALLERITPGKPDYTEAEEYGRTITDPFKAIQAQRMTDLTRREEEARAMLERRLAGMQDTRPQWLRAIQTAGASGDASKPLGGLQALAQAGQTIRQEKTASAEKALELEQAHIAMVNQLRDAGFGLQEANLIADKEIFNMRRDARKAVDARVEGALAPAVTRAGQISSAAERQADRVSSAAERQADREARAKSIAQSSKGDLAQLRITLDSTINRLRAKTFLEPEEEAQLEEALADRRVVMAALAGRSNVELPSQRGGAGTPAAPKIGEVQQGYRYKGGDPANPSSWEKVK